MPIGSTRFSNTSPVDQNYDDRRPSRSSRAAEGSSTQPIIEERAPRGADQNHSKRHMARLGLDESRGRKESRGGDEYYSPRSRKPHRDSSGSSENSSPSTLFRSLRIDEDPYKQGLRPPANNDPSVSARMHVEKGSRLNVPSEFVSSTRSLKTAAAWAATNDGGRVARFRNPRPDAEVYDLTDPVQADSVFGSSRTPARNFAKGSQEVVIRGGVPPENIQAVYEARPVSAADYEAAKTNRPVDMYGQLKSRSRVTIDKQPALPTPVQLYEIPRPPRSPTESFGGYASPQYRMAEPSSGYGSPPRGPAEPFGGYASPRHRIVEPSGGYGSPPRGTAEPFGNYARPEPRLVEPSREYSSPPRSSTKRTYDTGSPQPQYEIREPKKKNYW